MTLQEKFKQWLDTDPRVQISQSEVIADDFAIGFAEWCDDNYFRMGNTSFWAESTDWDNNKKLTTKELLEIYKETL